MNGSLQSVVVTRWVLDFTSPAPRGSRGTRCKSGHVSGHVYLRTTPAGRRDGDCRLDITGQYTLKNMAAYCSYTSPASRELR